MTGKHGPVGEIGPPYRLAPQAPAPGAFPRSGPTPHLMLSPYGTQTTRAWTAADQEVKSVIDAMRCEYLWRVSAVGDNVQLAMEYGTQGTIAVANIRLPFEGFVPGQVGIRASKVDPASAASVVVTLTVATGGSPTVRTRATAPAALPSSARLYTALTASTLTVDGVPGIAVAAGASLPLVSPSSVTAGAGIVELAL